MDEWALVKFLRNAGTCITGVVGKETLMPALEKGSYFSGTLKYLFWHPNNTQLAPE